jgi:hypothetical protein
MWHRATLTVCAGVLILLAACATPIQVERVNPGAVQRELTSNVISSGQISPETQIVLQQRDLWQLYKRPGDGDRHPAPHSRKWRAEP